MGLILKLNCSYNFWYICIKFIELRKYLERKEELESRQIKQQHTNYIQSFGASTIHSSSIEHKKKKLELPENGKIKLT